MNQDNKGYEITRMVVTSTRRGAKRTNQDNKGYERSQRTNQDNKGYEDYSNGCNDNSERSQMNERKKKKGLWDYSTSCNDSCTKEPKRTNTKGLEGAWTGVMTSGREGAKTKETIS